MVGLWLLMSLTSELFIRVIDNCLLYVFAMGVCWMIALELSLDFMAWNVVSFQAAENGYAEYF